MVDLNDFRIVVVDWVKEPVLLCTMDYFNYLKDIKENNEHTFQQVNDDEGRLGYYKIREYVENELSKLYNIHTIRVKFHQNKYGMIDNVDFIISYRDTDDEGLLKKRVPLSIYLFCSRYGLTDEFYHISFKFIKIKD